MSILNQQILELFLFLLEYCLRIIQDFLRIDHDRIFQDFSPSQQQQQRQRQQ